MKVKMTARLGRAAGSAFLFACYALAFALVLLLCSCGLKRVVQVSKEYNLNWARRVAVLEFEANQANAELASMASDLFAKHLLRIGYDVVERQKLAEVLSEHRLSLSGAVSDEQAKRVGELSGVDALLTGSVPIYRDAGAAVGSGDAAGSKAAVGSGDAVEAAEAGRPFPTRRQARRPGRTGRAAQKAGGSRRAAKQEIGVTCRLIDVQTSEVIWVASDVGKGQNAHAAADTVIAGIADRLQQYLKTAPVPKEKEFVPKKRLAEYENQRSTYKTRKSAFETQKSASKQHADDKLTQKSTPKSGVISTPKKPYKLNKSAIKILEIMKGNPKVRVKDIEPIIGIKKRAIFKNIKKLKSLGLLKRIGPSKGGHWEVVE